jgi:hypothetical protein
MQDRSLTLNLEIFLFDEYVHENGNQYLYACTSLKAVCQMNMFMRMVTNIFMPAPVLKLFASCTIPCQNFFLHLSTCHLDWDMELWL